MYRLVTITAELVNVFKHCYYLSIPNTFHLLSSKLMSFLYEQHYGSLSTALYLRTVDIDCKHMYSFRIILASNQIAKSSFPKVLRTA